MKKRGALLHLGLVATLVTLLAACGGQIQVKQPSASPTPAPALSWRQVALPKGVQLDNAGFAASPVNGQDAWICAPQTARSFAIWVTMDAGTSWNLAATLSPQTPQNPSLCDLVPDQDNAHALAVVFTWGSGEADTLDSMSYFSTDDGSHWRRVPGNLRVEEVASLPGETYAILGSDASQPTSPPPGLVVSTDDLQSWQAIQAEGLSSIDIAHFWLTPTTGQLLAGTFDSAIWLVDDGGTRWTLGRPVEIDMQTAIGAWLASQGRWLICGWPSGEATQLKCSRDLGATWQSEPAIVSTLLCEDCGKGAPATTTNACAPSVIAPDGSLFAICLPADVQPGQSAFLTYRLPPGASVWDSLGAAPGATMIATAARYLWCLNAASSSDSVSTLSVVAVPV